MKAAKSAAGKPAIFQKEPGAQQRPTKEKKAEKASTPRSRATAMADNDMFAAAAPKERPKSHLSAIQGRAGKAKGGPRIIDARGAAAPTRPGSPTAARPASPRIKSPVNVQAVDTDQPPKDAGWTRPSEKEGQKRKLDNENAPGTLSAEQPASKKKKKRVTWPDDSKLANWKYFDKNDGRFTANLPKEEVNLTTTEEADKQRAVRRAPQFPHPCTGA